MAGKKRLDVLLTEQGLAESRQKAQAIIMAGQVFWDVWTKQGLLFLKLRSWKYAGRHFVMSAEVD